MQGQVIDHTPQVSTLMQESHASAAPIVSEHTAIIQVIERAALNPDIDVDKMERLLAMQERIIAKQAEQGYADAMVAAQAEMPVVIAKETNTQTNSKYADLEAVNRVAKPIYTKHGFSVSFDTDVSPLPNCVRIIATVLHRGGHSKSFNYDAPIDDAGAKGVVNKTPTHGRASSVSYTQRYLLKIIFNITIAGEDNDGNGATNDKGVNVEDIKEMGRKEAIEKIVIHQNMVRDCINSVVCIKNGIATGQLSVAAEAWFELDDTAADVLWLATTKGGIFTTHERDVMKSSEFREAHFGPAPQA
jgi:hypothetical protein